MKNKTALIALVTAILLAAASPAWAQETPKPIRIGFVSVAKVLDQCEDGKKIKAELDKLKTEQQAELTAIKDQIEKLESEIKTKGMLWDEYTRQLKQSEYYNLVQKVEIEKRRMERAFQVKREQVLPPFEQKVGKVLEKIGDDGNYTLILDTSPLSPALPLNNILYADDALDITDKVIAELNKTK